MEQDQGQRPVRPAKLAVEVLQTESLYEVIKEFCEGHFHAANALALFSRIEGIVEGVRSLHVR